MDNCLIPGEHDMGSHRLSLIVLGNTGAVRAATCRSLGPFHPRNLVLKEKPKLVGHDRLCTKARTKRI